MLEVESEQRYTALQVLEHPWVTVSAVGDSDTQGQGEGLDVEYV